eukprot:m.104996 g.104996  ORF g.104996 m.104996 type:complete len:349 (-) comp10544_c0_seq4:3278-4324(-)
MSQSTPSTMAPTESYNVTTNALPDVAQTALEPLASSAFLSMPFPENIPLPHAPPLEPHRASLVDIVGAYDPAGVQALEHRLGTQRRGVGRVGPAASTTPRGGPAMDRRNARSLVRQLGEKRGGPTRARQHNASQSQDMYNDHSQHHERVSSRWAHNDAPPVAGLVRDDGALGKSVSATSDHASLSSSSASVSDTDSHSGDSDDSDTDTRRHSGCVCCLFPCCSQFASSRRRRRDQTKNTKTRGALRQPGTHQPALRGYGSMDTAATGGSMGPDNHHTERGTSGTSGRDEIIHTEPAGDNVQLLDSDSDNEWDEDNLDDAPSGHGDAVDTPEDSDPFSALAQARHGTGR